MRLPEPQTLGEPGDAVSRPDVPLGTVVGPFGVKGWVKIHSHTNPPANIINYSPWLVAEAEGTVERRVLDGRPHGNIIVARLEGITDRDQAALLQRSTVSVPRYRLPSLKKGEFYWTDLLGLRVETLEGVALGTVAAMMETGANDVMVASGERERLIPFVLGPYVKDVRLDDRVIVVDWDPEF